MIRLRFCLLLVLLAACSLLLHQQSRAQERDDHLIVPWQRIGPITLGMNAEELFGIMGHPTATKRGALDRGVDVYTWRNDLSATITKDGAYVTQICAFSPSYTTAQGIRPGSADRSVSAALGEPRRSRLFSAWWGASYTNLYWPGLMVSIHLEGFDQNHAVWEVCVNRFA
jgi:hypothetical protein